MEIRRFLGMLYRRLPVIFAVAAVAMAVVVGAGFLIPPTYTAQTTVRVLWDVGVYDISPRDYVADRLVTTYREVLQSEPVLEEAIRRVSPEGAPMTASELQDNLSIEMVPDSELMTIRVSDTIPSQAQDLANELATLLVQYAQAINVGYEGSADEILDDQVASLESELRQEYEAIATVEAENKDSAIADGLVRQLREKEDVYARLLDRAEMVRSYEALRTNSVKVIAPASLPTEPDNQLGRQEIGLALVIGLAGGVGLALLLDNLDTRIKNPEQAERLAQLPVLGSVPASLSPTGGGQAGPSEGNPRDDEPYRLLGASLLALTRDPGRQIIMVTPTSAHAGGSAVASSLAPIVAQTGKSLLLVDTNLRQPTVHQDFDLANRIGLTNVLDKQASLDEAIQRTITSGVHVLTSGAVPTNPSRVLSSPDLADLIRGLAGRFDLVFLNTAPALAEPDAFSLAHTVDGVLVQLEQQVSTEDELRQALQRLRAVQAPLLGLILVHKTKKRRRTG